MIRLLEFLIDGCWHKWTVYGMSPLVSNSPKEVPIGRRIYFQCEKCGTVKRKTFQ